VVCAGVAVGKVGGVVVADEDVVAAEEAADEEAGAADGAAFEARALVDPAGAWGFGCAVEFADVWDVEAVFEGLPDVCEFGLVDSFADGLGRCDLPGLMPFPNANRSLCVRSHSVFGLTTRYRHASPIYLVAMGVKISIVHNQRRRFTLTA